MYRNKGWKAQYIIYRLLVDGAKLLQCDVVRVVGIGGPFTSLFFDIVFALGFMGVKDHAGSPLRSTCKAFLLCRSV